MGRRGQPGTASRGAELVVEVVRILLVTPFPLYPTDTGGRIRTARIFERLSRTHDIAVVCFRPPYVPHEHLARMYAFARRIEYVDWRAAPNFSMAFYGEVAASLGSALPYTVRKYRSREFARRLAALVAEEHYDALVCDFLQPAVNCIDLRFRPKVLFQHNVEAEIFRRHAEARRAPHERMLFWWEYVKLARFERRTCRAFESCIAVSERDAERLRESCGDTPVHAVPTGVDTEYFTPRPSAERHDTIVFVGSMDWLPNQDAVEYFTGQILPAIQRRMGVRFVVAGRHPTERLRQLARETAGMSVTGTVEDIRPYLAEAALVVIPLRIGGGTRIKAYEAMAMQRAVLSTSLGIEGLPVSPGEHVEVADDAASFAERAVELLTDRARRTRLGAAARQFVELEGSWDLVAARFAKVCEEAVENSRGIAGCD